MLEYKKLLQGRNDTGCWTYTSFVSAFVEAAPARPLFVLQSGYQQFEVILNSAIILELSSKVPGLLLLEFCGPVCISVSHDRRG